MRYRKDWALAGSAIALMLSLSAHAQTQIASYRLGDGTGEDWEPAIISDGGYVYALWPHYLATTYKDSSGATCMAWTTRGGGKNNTTGSYMYFQASSNGGSAWTNVIIPRCPVNGTVVDAQLALRGIWAEGESYIGSGDVYYSKF